MHVNSGESIVEAKNGPRLSPGGRHQFSQAERRRQLAKDRTKDKCWNQVTVCVRRRVVVCPHGYWACSPSFSYKDVTGLCFPSNASGWEGSLPWQIEDISLLATFDVLSWLFSILTVAGRLADVSCAAGGKR